MSEDYKKKYLEYKLKYIQLKQTMQNANQTGGAFAYTSIKKSYNALKRKVGITKPELEAAFIQYETEISLLKSKERTLVELMKKPPVGHAIHYLREEITKLINKINSMEQNVILLLNSEYSRFNYHYDEETDSILELNETDIIFTGTPEATARLQAIQIYANIIRNRIRNDNDKRLYEVYESTAISNILREANGLRITPNELFADKDPIFLQKFNTDAERIKEESRQRALNEIMRKIINRIP
jgi:hypothetical protein